MQHCSNPIQLQLVFLWSPAPCPPPAINVLLLYCWCLDIFLISAPISEIARSVDRQWTLSTCSMVTIIGKIWSEIVAPPKKIRQNIKISAFRDLIVNVARTKQVIVKRKRTLQVAFTHADRYTLKWWTLVYKLRKIVPESGPTKRAATTYSRLTINITDVTVMCSRNVTHIITWSPCSTAETSCEVPCRL